MTDCNRIAEVATGIICACLPIIPAFFRHFYPKVVKSLSERRSKLSSTYGKGSRASRAVEVSRSNLAGYYELAELNDSTSKKTRSANDSLARRGGEIRKTTEIEQIEEAV